MFRAHHVSLASRVAQGGRVCAEGRQQMGSTRSLKPRMMSLHMPAQLHTHVCCMFLPAQAAGHALAYFCHHGQGTVGPSVPPGWHWACDESMDLGPAITPGGPWVFSVKWVMKDFYGGPVVKNLSANAGDTGLIPGPGKIPHGTEQLRPCTSTRELPLLAVTMETHTQHQRPSAAKNKVNK